MPREKIPIHQVRLGLYIEVPLKWWNHPFMTSRFMLRDREQLLVLRQLGLDFVWYYPEKSEARPAAAAKQPAQGARKPATASQKRESGEQQAALNRALKLKKARAAALERRRREIQAVEKQYTQVVSQVKSLMMQMNSLPAQSIREAGAVVEHIVSALMDDRETVVHLMNANDPDDTHYYHALNVSVLSLLLAKELKLPARLMEPLGFAALLHDIGKSRIPPKILRKTGPLNRAERDFYQMHVSYGAELIDKLSPDNPLVRDVIAQHHEMCDGSGYPEGLKGEQISQLAKLVCIVNHYDNLCNQNDLAQSLTPHEALSLMYGKQGSKFHKPFLEVFVKMLGVYPPGTVVQLSDGHFGLVLTLNPDALLRPGVMIHEPSVPREQAVIVDLREHPELEIRKSIRPAQLAPEVFDYLSPRERVSYFFRIQETESSSSR